MGFGIHPLNCHVPSHEQIDYRVLFGAFGKVSDAKATAEEGAMREANAEDSRCSLRTLARLSLCLAMEWPPRRRNTRFENSPAP